MINKQADTHTAKFSQEKLKDMIASYVEPQRVPEKINIITDTSDYFRVDYNDVVILNGHPYLIRNYEKEGRFGIEEQPKFWVKRAIDLSNGDVKIIKMVFPERFEAKVGDITFQCVRSPKKEARILELVRGHANFMQGFSVKDAAGNIVRIIDYIHGPTLEEVVSGLSRDHENYFFNHFPSVFDDYIELVEAIKFLHDHGEKHGDIRRDHVIKDSHSGSYRWIDFDFNYWHEENRYGYDLFGLGNILTFIAGGRDVTVQYLEQTDQAKLRDLTIDDMNIIFNHRVVNLKKIYPYIPEALNFILLHFSVGANLFYDETSQFLDDLYEVRDNLVSP